MKTKAKEFSVALGRVLPLLKTRTTLPILTHVKLIAGMGVLQVVATDLDAYALASCQCEGDLTQVCVDGASLKYLVSQAGEEISMELEAGKLIVKGNGTASLSTLPAVEFPEWPEEGTGIGIPVADLAECIKAVAWSTDLNPKITIDLWKECVWIRTTSKSIEACGCNGREFAYVNRPLICVPAQFMFPAKQADLFVDALNTGAEVVALSDKYIMSESPTFQVAVRLAEGKYMPVEFLLTQQNEPLGLLGSVELAPVLEGLHTIRRLDWGADYLPARIEFEPEQITILFRSERANFEKSIPRKHEGKPVAIHVDVDKAIRVFSHVQPGAKGFLGKGAILLACGDYTYALGLLIGKHD